MTGKADQSLDAVLGDAARLAALRATGLLDSPPENAFDRLAGLARRVLRAPVCLISLVDGDRAFFKSCVGLAEPWASRREAPLSHSFSPYVVATGAPVVVEDARADPLLRDRLAVSEMNVIAYLGTPLVTAEAQTLGSFCVIDTRPRNWTPEEIALMRDLADSVVSEIELSVSNKAAREREAELRRRNDEFQAALAAAENARLRAEQAAAAQRESETQFHRLADAIPQLAWIADADGWIIWYNRRWYEYTGATPEHMEGWGWQSVHDPQTLPEVLERWRRSIASGEPFEMVFPLRGADGAFRNFLTRVQPIRSGDGRLTRWFGTNTDVDELKRVEEALRETNARLEKVLEVETVGVMFWDLGTGLLTDANETFLKMLGYSRSDLEAGELTWQKLTPPEHHAASLAELEKFKVSGRVGPYEKEYLHKDGTRQWFVFAGSSIGGKSCVEFCVDVSARKNVEIQLRESQQRTLLATEAAEVGIWEWNVATGKIWWDAQMFRIYGMAPTDDGVIPFADWAAAVAPEDLLHRKEAADTTVHEGGRSEREFRIRRRDNGEVRDIRAIETVRVNPEGKVEWLVGTNLDITRRKEADEHIRLLMGEVNHRSRNLLGVVQSIAKLSARHADPVRYVSDLSERISSLAACQNLLVASDWKGIDIADLTRAQLSSFRDILGRRILLDGGPARLRPSAAQGLGLALHELATNAAKYGALSNGDGLVRISWGVASGEMEPMFWMHWVEEGGPRVAAPTRTGFGRTVIVSMMQHAVKGQVAVDYPETGLSWRLLAPVRSTLDSE
ncbi:PAS domain S-box protein [Rhodoblastus sp.]|uniref:PAS domain S-box protein n=1 Tax=Rhodoblastus sp. TaxID=1962975 RepID=UPI0026023A20|nr:PAS domain S-box protein [Rhodoblastus sp.]